MRSHLDVTVQWFALLGCVLDRINRPLYDSSTLPRPQDELDIAVLRSHRPRRRFDQGPGRVAAVVAKLARQFSVEPHTSAIDDVSRVPTHWNTNGKWESPIGSVARERAVMIVGTCEIKMHAAWRGTARVAFTRTYSARVSLTFVRHEAYQQDGGRPDKRGDRSGVIQAASISCKSRASREHARFFRIIGKYPCAW